MKCDSRGCGFESNWQSDSSDHMNHLHERVRHLGEEGSEFEATVQAIPDDSVHFLRIERELTDDDYAYFGEMLARLSEGRSHPILLGDHRVEVTRRDPAEGEVSEDTPQPRYTDAEFRTFLDWWMASDDVPEDFRAEGAERYARNDMEQAVIDNLDQEARRRGFDGIAVAYHEFVT